MKKSIFIIVFTLLANSFVVTGAFSHPHMFLDTTASFKIGENNQLKSIMLRFVVDELNTALTIATLDVDKDGDKVLTKEDKKKVAGSVIKGFAHYNFFTYLEVNNKDVSLKAPTYSEIDFVNGHLVIAMEVFLEAPLSVTGNKFTLELYDPTYFTEVILKEAPKIIGQKKQCRVAFDKAASDEDSQKIQSYLAQLSREETPDIENVGALFADQTRLVCS